MNLPSNSHNNLISAIAVLFLQVCGFGSYLQYVLCHQGHVFTGKVLVYLLCAREKVCFKSNIVFMDQGILYYFIHIIFSKLLLRYILTLFV